LSQVPAEYDIEFRQRPVRARKHRTKPHPRRTLQ
jgi:hypothetical protein